MAKGGGGSRGGSTGGGGGGSSSGGAGSLNSLDKFEDVALKELDALTKDVGKGMALIADLRDKIGDKAGKEAFDKNILDMQRRGIVQTVVGGVSMDQAVIARAVKGGIRTELGGDRVYIRRG